MTRSYHSKSMRLWFVKKKYEKFCDKIEVVQRRFTRMVFFKFNFGESEVCRAFEALEIVFLRVVIARNEIVLCKIIHNEIDVQLHELIFYCQINRFTKNVDIFYVPNWSANVEINSPLLQLQRQSWHVFTIFWICRWVSLNLE